MTSLRPSLNRALEIHPAGHEPHDTALYSQAPPWRFVPIEADPIRLYRFIEVVPPEATPHTTEFNTRYSHLEYCHA